MSLPNRARPFRLWDRRLRVANESRNPRMAFRFFIVIADLQPRTTGLPYTSFRLREKVLKELERWFFQTASSQRSPRGGYWESIVSREVVENHNSFILGASDAWREPLESGRFRRTGWDCGERSGRASYEPESSLPAE